MGQQHQCTNGLEKLHANDCIGRGGIGGVEEIRMTLTPISQHAAQQRLSLVNFKNTPMEDLKNLLSHCSCYALDKMTLALMITKQNTLWVQALGGVSTGKGANKAFDVCEKLARYLKMPLEFQTARKGLASMAVKRGYITIEKTNSPFVVCRLESP